jgi:putative cell wall-binding protein
MAEGFPVIGHIGRPLAVALLLALLAPAAPAAAQEPSGPGSSLQNPIFPHDFPDPSLLRVDGRYYAYRTNTLANVPVIASEDLATWTDLGDALPQLPAWSERGSVWAPAVLPRGKRFVLYYTTREVATGLQCLSRADGESPAGPFVDRSAGPLLCQRERGGSIDPAPFVDGDGTPHLLFKSEGVVDREPPIIWSVGLTPDGLDVVGEPVELLRQDRAWEFPIVEGPALLTEGGRYHLFYAANRWETAEYAIGHAVCDSVRGPCRKTGDGPLLASGGDIAGPGAPEPFRDAQGALWLAYHAWTPGEVGYPAGARRLRLASLAFVDDRPVLGGTPGGSVSLVRAARVAGADRFATAAALSRARFPVDVPVATVATGSDFPDALAAAPAARAGQGPLLLVTRDELPAATAAELARLQPRGVRVLGGTSAISDAVVDAIGAVVGSARVQRVAGAERAATAAALSASAFPGGARAAFVVSGEVAADALSAGGTAAAMRAPILLTGAGSVPPVTLDELRRLAPGQVVVVGGQERVAPSVERALAEAVPGAEVVRVAGRDRYDTAVTLAGAFQEPVTEVLAVTGERFPDALAAGSLGRPVLLVPPGGAPPEVRAEAARLATRRVLVLGGTAAVDDRTFATLDLR